MKEVLEELGFKHKYGYLYELEIGLYKEAEESCKARTFVENGITKRTLSAGVINYALDTEELYIHSGLGDTDSYAFTLLLRDTEEDRNKLKGLVNVLSVN